MSENQNIFGRDGLYRDLRGGGRGLNAQLNQVTAGLKARPDLFIGSRKNVGKTQLAAGYSFTGGAGKQLVDTITYRGGHNFTGGTFNVYRDAPAEPEPAPEEPADEPVATTQPVTDPTPANPYQGQIDELTNQIGTISGQIGGYTNTINNLNNQISSMQTNFSRQLETIMAANTKALEDMNTQYQQQLQAQQEANERARQERELAAQTAAANQARAGQQAEFQLGSGAGIMRGIFGGLAGFKRRGKVKLVSSDSLSIAGNKEKSPNKMLNV